jgi:hypothetical protein
VKTAVILLGHGSRAENNIALAEVAGIINEIGGVEFTGSFSFIARRFQNP